MPNSPFPTFVMASDSDTSKIILPTSANEARSASRQTIPSTIILTLWYISIRGASILWVVFLFILRIAGQSVQGARRLSKQQIRPAIKPVYPTQHTAAEVLGDKSIEVSAGGDSVGQEKINAEEKTKERSTPLGNEEGLFETKIWPGAPSSLQPRKSENHVGGDARPEPVLETDFHDEAEVTALVLPTQIDSSLGSKSGPPLKTQTIVSSIETNGQGTSITSTTEDLASDQEWLSVSGTGDTDYSHDTPRSFLSSTLRKKIKKRPKVRAPRAEPTARAAGGTPTVFARMSTGSASSSISGHRRSLFAKTFARRSQGESTEELPARQSRLSPLTPSPKGQKSLFTDSKVKKLRTFYGSKEHGAHIRTTTKGVTKGTGEELEGKDWRASRHAVDSGADADSDSD